MLKKLARYCDTEMIPEQHNNSDTHDGLYRRRIMISPLSERFLAGGHYFYLKK
tara:strand:+ start:76929 stop:77087 length:159 start_codon:yes stop_codon:yes gene_type:complete